MNSPLKRYERLGQGLGQPILPDDDGRLPVVSGPEKVRQAMFTILDTEPGERVMRADFGCGLRRFLMAPNNPATRAGIEREIAQSLARWVPNCRLALSLFCTCQVSAAPTCARLKLARANFSRWLSCSIVVCSGVKLMAKTGRSTHFLLQKRADLGLMSPRTIQRKRLLSVFWMQASYLTEL